MQMKLIRINSLHNNNPKNEISLISNIKTVNEIKNDTSLKIRNQYETFPYPSWVYCKSQAYKHLFRNI